MRIKNRIVISDKISKLNICGRVRHPINSNRGKVKYGTRPAKRITSARRWVHGYSITAVPAKSVAHVSF